MVTGIFIPLLPLLSFLVLWHIRGSRKRPSLSRLVSWLKPFTHLASMSPRITGNELGTALCLCTLCTTSLAALRNIENSSPLWTAGSFLKTDTTTSLFHTRSRSIMISWELHYDQKFTFHFEKWRQENECQWMTTEIFLVVKRLFISLYAISCSTSPFLQVTLIFSPAHLLMEMPCGLR